MGPSSSSVRGYYENRLPFDIFVIMGWRWDNHAQVAGRGPLLTIFASMSNGDLFRM